MFGTGWSVSMEGFWEGLDEIMAAKGKRLMLDFNNNLFQGRATKYADAIYRKSGALQNCIGFVDGTVIKIATTKGYKIQKVYYNGYKRYHTLKFQAVASPDRLSMHAAGLMESRRHDWTL